MQPLYTYSGGSRKVRWGGGMSLCLNKTGAKRPSTGRSQVFWVGGGVGCEGDTLENFLKSYIILVNFSFLLLLLFLGLLKICVIYWYINTGYSLHSNIKKADRFFCSHGTQVIKICRA